MFRTQRLDALVLKTQRIGEIHRLVTMFNPVEGNFSFYFCYDTRLL
jgi:recombinational DNA repair protein (RecF pathway)